MPAILTPYFCPAYAGQKILVPSDGGSPTGFITAAFSDPVKALRDPQHDHFFAWLLTYKPLIDWCEERDVLLHGFHDILDDLLESVLLKLHEEVHERWQRTIRLWRETARSLQVMKVSDVFEIRESEGREEVVIIPGRRTVTLPGRDTD
nr:hypothetical protein B0A51_18448 [Rachicladosporium sp. CCFEE 5018]